MEYSKLNCEFFVNSGFSHKCSLSPYYGVTIGESWLAWVTFLLTLLYLIILSLFFRRRVEYLHSYLGTVWHSHCTYLAQPWSKFESYCQSQRLYLNGGHSQSFYCNFYRLNCIYLFFFPTQRTMIRLANQETSWTPHHTSATPSTIPASRNSSGSAYRLASGASISPRSPRLKSSPEHSGGLHIKPKEWKLVTLSE